MNVASSPSPTKPVPMIGAIQKTCLSAVQPYRNTANLIRTVEINMVWVLTANGYDE